MFTGITKKFWIKVHSMYVTDEVEERDGMPSTFACEAGGMRNDAPSHFLHSPRLSRPLSAVPNIWRGLSGLMHG